VLKKIRTSRYANISAFTGGRYDDLGHLLRSKRQQVSEYDGVLFYRAAATEKLAGKLSIDAAKAVEAGPFSVYDKNACAPSGDKGDYYSGAPYWWPNPDTADGLPYVRRDCDRIPNTELYSSASKHYDRTSLQYLIDNVTALTLAGGDINHRKAAFLLRHWFLDQKSAMKPHMKYAQVRVGIDKNNGAPTGLIEARDIAFLTDCMRILATTGALSPHDVEEFKSWFISFLGWLQNAPQALKERRGGNNHGTNYDLLTLTLLLFVGDKAGLKSHVARSLHRLPQQFAENGDQPAEAKRPHVLHYCTYNLQSWLWAARALEGAGANVTGEFSEIFNRAAHHLWRRYLADPAQAGREGFEVKRLVPLFREIETRTPEGWITEALQHDDLQDPPHLFHPFTGIPPYWRALAVPE